MVQLDYLEKLIPLLKRSGCSHIKMEGLELSITQELPGYLPDAKTPAPPPIPDPSPDDFKSDELMSYDDILFHAVGGAPLPLTGEEDVPHGT